MRGRPGTLWHRAYLPTLSAGCLVILVGAGRAAGRADLPSIWAPALVILGMYLVARRFPLRLGGRSRVEYSACTSLGFALLLLVPTSVAVLALACAALIPSPGGRIGSWRRRVLEVIRTTVVVTAAGTVMSLGQMSLALTVLPTALATFAVLAPAGVIAYALDATLTAAAAALEQRTPFRPLLVQARRPVELAAYLLLVSLAPFIVVLVEQSLLLAPALVVALVALQRVAGRGAPDHRDALQDALTGLANRRALELRLADLIERARDGDRFAVLLLDLDRFSEVNEQLGHELGDQLLRRTGERLSTHGGLELVARIGGDEYAVLVGHHGADDPAASVALAHQLIDAIAAPERVAGVQMSVAATVGVALFPQHGDDVSSLIRRADAALYDAKRDRIPVAVATGGAQRELVGRVSLVSELERAMRDDELELEYQPKLCLSTFDIAGVESLLRWRHPERGLVPPDAFVTTVEHTDLIAPLTRYVLRRALADLGRWGATGLQDLAIAVNISTRDLQDARFPTDLGQLLRSNEVDPSLLTLEITETALHVDAERAARTLAALRDLGVRLSIDDFGTGYSSLSALRHLPVCELKIDRVFVAAMHDEAGTAIVRSMIQLGQALHLEVVAEGVEDDRTIDRLRGLGCDVVQGYVVGRPLPAAEVPAWVTARREELASVRTLPFARAVDAIGRLRTRVG